MMVVVGMRLMTTMTMMEFEHKDDSIIKDDDDDAGKSDNERQKIEYDDDDIAPCSSKKIAISFVFDLKSQIKSHCICIIKIAISDRPTVRLKNPLQPSQAKAP